MYSTDPYRILFGYCFDVAEERYLDVNLRHVRLQTSSRGVKDIKGITVDTERGMSTVLACILAATK
jgi:hypothetical protein